MRNHGSFDYYLTTLAWWIRKLFELAVGLLCSRNILGFLQFDCQFFYTILELIDLLSSVVFVQYILDLIDCCLIDISSDRLLIKAWLPLA